MCDALLFCVSDGCFLRKKGESIEANEAMKTTHVRSLAVDRITQMVA